MRAFIVLAVAGLTAASPALAGPVVKYACANGQAFAMDYADTGARIVFPNGIAAAMQHVRMASGAHYAGGGYEYDEWHGSISLTIAKPIRHTTSCHVLK